MTSLLYLNYILDDPTMNFQKKIVKSRKYQQLTPQFSKLIANMKQILQNLYFQNFSMNLLTKQRTIFVNKIKFQKIKNAKVTTSTNT